ncbi:MAG: response regulator [Magnetococcales bacterium]|nr:response regulator [Magnetococcales bacterium]
MQTILIVEDSKSLAVLFKDRIESRLGIEVVVAYRADEARRMMAGRPPPFFLALSNIVLPDAPDGAIIDDILSQGIPVMVLTGTYDRALHEHILRKGGLDYFVKDNIGVVDSVIHAIDRIRRNRTVQVIVADDSRSSRRLVADALRRYNFVVLEADHGLDALALLAHHPAQLVITDYQMPKMDGLQLTKKIRTHYSRDTVAVVGLSSVEDRSLAIQFIKAGANDFLIKPFQSEELLCRVYQNIDMIERHADLHQLVTQHQSILDNALDAIITIDAQGRVLDYNPAAQALFGYTRDTIVGRDLADLIVPEPFRQQHRQALARWQDNPAATLQRRIEMPALRADGRTIELQISLTRVTHNGQIRFTAFLQDITERKQLMTSLKETLAVAESASRAKSDFIANMSHEIRTPMNAIIGFTDLGLKVDLPVRVHDYLEKIKNASHSLMGIIHNILDFSRMDAGQLTLDPVAFDLHQMLERLSDLFSRQASEQGIELLFMAPVAFDDVLHGDVARLEQVLINLIRNAIKFTHQGSVVVTVQPSRLDHDQVLLRCAVRDSGIGIDPAMLSRIFEPFVQADSSITRQYGGTGLGLSICKSIVQLMEGAIQVESIPGQGSQFSFHVTVGYHGSNRRARPTVSDGLEQRRVLVACHHALLQQQLETLLLDMKLQPVSATPSDHALFDRVLSSAHDNPFLAVLADWSPSGHEQHRDGIHLLGELRAAWSAEMAALPPPRLILMTPFGLDDIKAHGEQVGIDDFLDKPVSRKRLLQVLTGTAQGSPAEVDRRWDWPLALERITSDHTAGARVLLADSNPISQQVIKELLNRVGMVVEIAHDWSEAIDKMHRYPHDLILFDLRLLQQDDRHRLQTLRSHDNLRSVPMIAMTEYVAPTEAHHFRAMGIHGYLDKPIRSERLYGLLRKLISIPTPPVPVTLQLTDPETIATLAVEADIDLQSALDHLAGNRELHRRLLLRLIGDQENDSTSIRSQLRHGDPASTLRHLHVMAGLAELVGAIPLLRALQMLERALSNADPISTNSAAAVVLNRIATLLQPFQVPAITTTNDLPSSSLSTRQQPASQLGTTINTLAAHLQYHSLAFMAALTQLRTLLATNNPSYALLRTIEQHGNDYEFPEALEALGQLARLLAIECPVAPHRPVATQQATLLIVDDQNSNIDLLREILTDFHLLVATDGRQALRLAQIAPPPDLILLDIMMPVMNGYEVCRRLKQQTDTAAIPIIFVTARKEITDETEGFAAGGVDYITKPFNPEIIRRRILTHLQLKRSHEELEQQVRQRTSELEQARREAEQGRQSAEAGNRAKSHFLATMSHEIRTPMNAILGMADLLWDSSLNTDQRKFVQIFRSAGENLLGILNDVLDIAKIESGQLLLEPITFHLADEIAVVTAMIAPQARAKAVELTCTIQTGIPAVLQGDPGRLRQILLNLLSNAVKFTERGSIHLTVAAQPTTDTAILPVDFQLADSGIGIAPDRLTTIFDRFVQADSSITRRYGGTGLGLAIVKQLVERMSGSIRVESQLDRGTTFYWTIPFAVGPTTPKMPPHQQDSSTAPSERSCRILLVDDSEDNRLLIEAYLKGGPYQLQTAENGAIALERLRHDRFHLVLMDVQMPVMDGYSATRAWRQIEQERQLPLLPIIALTANAMPEDIDHSLQAGCSSHLTKPIRKKALLAAIEKYIS